MLLAWVVSVGNLIWRLLKIALTLRNFMQQYETRICSRCVYSDHNTARAHSKGMFSYCPSNLLTTLHMAVRDALLSLPVVLQSAFKSVVVCAQGLFAISFKNVEIIQRNDH